MSRTCRFIILVAPMLLLAACGAAFQSTGMSPVGSSVVTGNVRCKASDNTCFVTIDTDDPMATSCGDYCFPIAPGYVIIDAPSGSQYQYIEWSLPRNSRAEFDINKGIVFKNSPTRPPFTNCKSGHANGQNDARSFHCTNHHTPQEQGMWAYTINLVLPPGTGTIQPGDPWVVNK